MKTFYIYVLPVLISCSLLLGVSALFSGCWTLKQGGIMIGYLHRAVPLEKLLDETKGSEDDIRFVERVRDIRRFAIEELGLKDTKNYTKYVNLEQDYLAAIVSASAKDSFKRYQWHFPIVGSVPYKGFFITDDAKAEAEKLKKKDLDVWIRPVDAFSTLGYFSDPLYSYMKKYPVYDLADMLIHELFHATVFIKSDMDFNESLAEFVGGEGARLYIIKTFGEDSHELIDISNRKDDKGTFVAFIQDVIAQLQIVYSSEASKEEKLLQKEAIISASQQRFEAGYDTMFKGKNYKGFSQMKINNAYLELYRLYYDGGDKFQTLYEENGQDLPRFIASMKALYNNRSKR
ncbi:aminopeptidase [Spirochaetia bacterium]|nr:aminopeptidase [Spirochaetia bacterium]